MSDTDIRPALTPEEWALLFDGDISWSGTLLCDNPHGAAAAAIHGQPYGFTREDVRAIRDLVGAWRSWSVMNAKGDHFESIADRIAALLPPEAP